MRACSDDESAHDQFSVFFLERLIQALFCAVIPSSNILIFGTVYSEIFASIPLVFSASLKNDERNEFVLRG